jgi:hypothetical protein
LNNGGDTVTLHDGTTVIASESYGSEGGDNQSLTRDPDIIGVFVKHGVATGSGGHYGPRVPRSMALYSAAVVCRNWWAWGQRIPTC